MDTKKSLISYSIMKSFHEQNKSVALAYSPFIEYALSIIPKDECTILNLKKVATEISCLDIPLLLLKSIINNLKTKGILECDKDYKNITYKEKHQKEKYENILAEKEGQNDFLIRRMRSFIEIDVSIDEMYGILSKFIYFCLEEFDIFDVQNDHTLLENPVFIKIAEFLDSIRISDIDSYNAFTDIYYGYILSTLTDEKEIEKYSRTMKPTRIYLDSNFMLRIIGLQSEYDEIASNEVIKLLKRFSFTLMTTDDLINEVRRVIFSVMKKIEGKQIKVNIPKDKQKYIDGVVGAIIRRKMSVSSLEKLYRDIENVIISFGVAIDRTAKIDTIEVSSNILNRLIEKKEYRYKQQYHDFDEEYYFEGDVEYEIPEKQKERIKQNSITDLQLIEFIKRMRKNLKVYYFHDSTALLLTCDKLLYNFNRNRRDKYEVPEVILEDALINILWLYNPTVTGVDVEISRIISIFQSSLFVKFDIINQFYEKLSILVENQPERKDVAALLSTNVLTNIELHNIGKESSIEYNESIEKIIYDAQVRKGRIFTEMLERGLNLIRRAKTYTFDKIKYFQSMFISVLLFFIEILLFRNMIVNVWSGLIGEGKFSLSQKIEFLFLCILIIPTLSTVFNLLKCLIHENKIVYKKIVWNSLSFTIGTFFIGIVYNIAVSKF